MKVPSSAALGTLTVTAKDLKEDPLLQLVTKLASSLQLTVVTPTNKKAPLSLELPSGKTLSQRNAIIRCLCGMGLHNALDDAMMGGHSKAGNASPSHAMAIASISSWMSVADHATREFDGLLSQVESHLETRAFLIPSATPTVADVDVACVICKKASQEEIAGFPNLHRWLVTVSAFLGEHGIKTALEVDPIKNSHAPPMFFYGTETVELPKKKVAAAPPVKKQPSQEQQQQQPKKEKQAKQPQQQQQKQPAASFDVSALDIRVGKIIKAWAHPEAEKLYCEEIDVGEDAPRQIASGLRPFYKTADDLTGKLVMVLCNLKKRNLVGFPSHGMVMCASNADHTSVEVMEPPADAKIGERIMFEGYKGDPEPENKVAKKKVFEAVAPDLKTNDQGVCVWKGAVSQTSGGPVKASKGMPNAHVA
jgi:aminoacyl tRNA synthase complex-interacting multifunctional protein 1